MTAALTCKWSRNKVLYWCILLHAHDSGLSLWDMDLMGYPNLSWGENCFTFKYIYIFFFFFFLPLASSTCHVALTIVTDRRSGKGTSHNVSWYPDNQGLEKEVLKKRASCSNCAETIRWFRVCSYIHRYWYLIPVTYPCPSLGMCIPTWGKYWAKCFIH